MTKLQIPVWQWTPVRDATCAAMMTRKGLPMFLSCQIVYRVRALTWLREHSLASGNVDIPERAYDDTW